MKQMPLWGRVIFCDWHGVLSRDPFWVSMGFADAVLIDDRVDNCTAFTSCGGAAIRWKMGTDDVGDVTGALKEWLDTLAQAAGAR
jgi:hypothetical protein